MGLHRCAVFKGLEVLLRFYMKFDKKCRIYRKFVKVSKILTKNNCKTYLQINKFVIK